MDLAILDFLPQRHRMVCQNSLFTYQ